MREDIHSTFQRAILRDEALRLLAAVNAVAAALVKMAGENREVLIPCYTNGVAAQPSNLAHFLLAHAAAFLRDADRIRSFYARLNECPIGSCVLNGTGWLLDRAGMADYLGFSRPVENTFDAGQVSGTDVAVEAALVLVHPMLQVGQFIAEVMQQYAQPRPWILVSATYASSAMPQKRNPGPLIDVRRDAGVVLAELQSVVMRAHNLPTGMYDAKDEKVNRAFVAEASDVLEAFAAVLGMLRVNPERALEELNLDWTASQELADVLMRRFRVPFRVGHALASRMVTVARTKGFTPKDFPIGEMRRLWTELVGEVGRDLPDLPADFPLDEAAFRRVLDPKHIVAERAVAGGPQSEELAKLFDSVGTKLSASRDALERERAAQAAAESRLEADFRALVHNRS